MNEEAQLDDLAHAIKKGRMKYSLHLAVALLVGFGGINLLFGNGLHWLCTSAWVSYVTIFGFIYLMIWPIKLGRAKKEIGERDVETIVSSQGAQDNSWMLAALILAVLVALTLFKGETTSEAEEQLENAPIDMKIMSADEEEVTLKIPQSFVNEQGGEEFGASVSEGSMPEGVMISAKLDDMGLHPIFDETDPESGQTITYDEYEISPRTNPEMVAIEIQPTQTKINEELIEAVYDEMMGGGETEVSTREEMGLSVRSARIKLPSTKIKGFVEVDDVQLGVPVDPALQHMFVVCENKICVLRASIDEVSDAHIYFHPSRFDEWEQIYWEMDQLLRGFVQEPPEE